MASWIVRNQGGAVVRSGGRCLINLGSIPATTPRGRDESNA
jgi:hypothetical protein